MRLLLVQLLSVACILSTAEVVRAQIVFGTVKIDPSGVLIEYSVDMPKTENVEQQFTVTVPYQENGVTKSREETRTRMVAVRKLVPETKQILPTTESHEFFNLAGKRITREECLSNAKHVLMLAPHQNITELHREVLRNSVMVIKQIPQTPENKK